MAVTGEPYTLARRMVIEEREREKAAGAPGLSFDGPLAVGEVLDGDAEAGEAAITALREKLASGDLLPPGRITGPELVLGPEEARFMGGFLHGAFQPKPSPGPPYTHVHKLPETEEEMAADPFLPSFTITREG